MEAVCKCGRIILVKIAKYRVSILTLVVKNLKKKTLKYL